MPRLLHMLGHAEVAELADALDSKSSSRKGVGVRLPPSAPHTNRVVTRAFFFEASKHEIHGPPWRYRSDATVFAAAWPVPVRKLYWTAMEGLPGRLGRTPAEDAEVFGKGGMQRHRSSYQPLPWPVETRYL